MWYADFSVIVSKCGRWSNLFLSLEASVFQESASCLEVKVKRRLLSTWMPWISPLCLSLGNWPSHMGELCKPLPWQHGLANQRTRRLHRKPSASGLRYEAFSWCREVLLNLHQSCCFGWCDRSLMQEATKVVTRGNRIILFCKVDLQLLCVGLKKLFPFLHNHVTPREISLGTALAVPQN